MPTKHEKRPKICDSQAKKKILINWPYSMTNYLDCGRPILGTFLTMTKSPDIPFFIIINITLYSKLRS